MVCGCCCSEGMFRIRHICHIHIRRRRRRQRRWREVGNERPTLRRCSASTGKWCVCARSRQQGADNRGNVNSESSQGGTHFLSQQRKTAALLLLWLRFFASFFHHLITDAECGAWKLYLILDENSCSLFFFSLAIAFFPFFTQVTIFIYAAASHGMPSAMWRQFEEKWRTKRRRIETKVFERMNGVGKNALNIVRKVKRGTCNARMKNAAGCCTNAHIHTSPALQCQPPQLIRVTNKRATLSGDDFFMFAIVAHFVLSLYFVCFGSGVVRAIGPLLKNIPSNYLCTNTMWPTLKLFRVGGLPHYHRMHVLRFNTQCDRWSPLLTWWFRHNAISVYSFRFVLFGSDTFDNRHIITSRAWKPKERERDSALSAVIGNRPHSRVAEHNLDCNRLVGPNLNCKINRIEMVAHRNSMQ